MKNFWWIFLLSSIGCRQVEKTCDIPPVENFEINRYLGTWYEICRLPQSFEKNMENVYAVYSLNTDGSLKVVNSGEVKGKKHSVTGIAHFKGAPSTAHLRVSFFRPFFVDYKIIKLDPDYKFALVTSSYKDSLWLLAKSPSIPPNVLNQYLSFAKLNNFNLQNLEFTSQSAGTSIENQ